MVHSVGGHLPPPPPRPTVNAAAAARRLLPKSLLNAVGAAPVSCIRDGGGVPPAAEDSSHSAESLEKHSRLAIELIESEVAYVSFLRTLHDTFYIRLKGLEALEKPVRSWLFSAPDCTL